MDKEYKTLKETAEKYRALYNSGKCSREQAIENIFPYLDLINNKSKELSKRYNQNCKKVSFSSFIR
jgi:hypothetical protein